MKIALVVYKGVQGNTLKFAEFIHEKHPEVDLFNVIKAPEDLSEYDMVGFCAAPYAFKWPVPMMRYIDKVQVKQGASFFTLSTSASGSPFNGKAKKALKKKGLTFVKAICIKGYAVLGKLKINKNRPNEKDLAKGLAKFEKILETK